MHFCIALLILLPLACGHMQMVTPPPFRSKFDSTLRAGEIDYNMKTPLSGDGSNYPCKLYHKGPGRVTAEYAAGGTYNLELQGEATHGGGSCQISLSYDNGQSFKVIKSIIGGCPSSQLNYKFTIPRNAPNGEPILAWTWLNRIGNREFYMNCARVKITGGGFGWNAPEIFKANIYGANCQTREQQEIIFPEPGDQVDYLSPQLKGQQATRLQGCPASPAQQVDSSGPISNGGLAVSAGPIPPQVPASRSATSQLTIQTRPASTVRLPPDAALPSLASFVPAMLATPLSAVGFTSTVSRASPPETTVVPSSMQSPAAPVMTSNASTAAALVPLQPSFSSSSATIDAVTSSADSSCAPDGSIICLGEGNSWALCSHGRPVNMGSVAAGTICRNGKISRRAIAGGGYCSRFQEGQTKCSHDNTEFSVCTNGAYVPVGPVPDGIVCKDGALSPVASTSRRAYRHRHRGRRHHY